MHRRVVGEPEISHDSVTSSEVIKVRWCAMSLGCNVGQPRIQIGDEEGKVHRESGHCALESPERRRVRDALVDLHRADSVDESDRLLEVRDRLVRLREVVADRVEEEAVPPDALERLREDLLEARGRVCLVATDLDLTVDVRGEVRVGVDEALVDRICLRDVREPLLVRRHLLDLVCVSRSHQYASGNEGRRETHVAEDDLTHACGDVTRVLLKLADEVQKVSLERLANLDNLLDVTEEVLRVEPVQDRRLRRASELAQSVREVLVLVTASQRPLPQVGENRGAPG